MTEVEDLKFTRKERQHLAVLQTRLDYIREQRPSGNGNVAGESNALAWVLSLVNGSMERAEVRIERLERRMRLYESRLGTLEKELTEEEEA